MNESEGFEIRFRCTDKDTHPSRELDRVRLSPDTELSATERLGPFTMREGKRSAGRVRLREDPILEKGVNMYRFACPTCRRDLQVKYENLIDMMDRLHAAGVSAVDISKLPATLSSN